MSLNKREILNWFLKSRESYLVEIKYNLEFIKYKKKKKFFPYLNNTFHNIPQDFCCFCFCCWCCTLFILEEKDADKNMQL